MTIMTSVERQDEAVRAWLDQQERRGLRVLVAARLSRKVVLADGDTSRGAQTGLESQDARIYEWAEREGHTIVYVAADYKSGTVSPWNRPNLKPWVTEPGKVAQYDAVVAYKLDRLSRGDSEETAGIEAWARQNGKKLLTVDGLEFPCEGNAGIRWDFAKRQAHQEWMDISERYKRMTAHLRSGGFHVGRAPYGFQSVKLDKHKTLVQVPAEAELIRDAATWYLDGASLDDICERLNAQGRLPRRMKNSNQPIWRASQLSKVLHNEVIAGRQKSLTGKTIMKVEPILSRDIWERVIARLASRTKRNGETGVSQSKAPALLTSIILCTRCDKNMYRTGPNYYCRVKGCKSIVRIDVADSYVNDAMMSDDRRDIIETVVPGVGHDAEIADVKRDLAEAVEAEEFGRLAGLQAELERLRALPASPPRVERRESDKTVAEMWAAMPDDVTRRAYLIERGARVEHVALVRRSDDEGPFALNLYMGQAQTV